MKTSIALALLVISTAAFAQRISYPNPCNPGMQIVDPAGRTFQCASDRTWKVTVDGADASRPDWLPSWLTLRNAGLSISSLFLFVLLLSSFFTVHTKEAGIVERLGKFSRIATEGLNFKIPLFESLVYTENLNMQLMDVDVTSKTSDDATVTVPVRVQYYVLAEKVKEAYYELDDPEDQIRAHVENVILSYVPKVSLDESYQQEDKIAAAIKTSLSEVMSRFGYSKIGRAHV